MAFRATEPPQLYEEETSQSLLHQVCFESFDNVRKGELSAQEVFAIKNTEQRRVAYERMDKIKMKELPNFSVLEEIKNDGYGYPMRLISFTMEGFSNPFYYLNCFCPSTGHEFFIETRKIDCVSAKMGSFGLSPADKFDKEW